jgi:DNA polymerase-1
MNVDPLRQYRQIWLVDFEFHQPAGERPSPICMVALEYHSGDTLRLNDRQLKQLSGAPFSTDQESLFVAYFASAELGCFLALGWPMPLRVLDLYVEFRRLTNDRILPAGKGLLGAMTYYGLAGIAPAVKEDMRALAVGGGPFTPSEMTNLVDYCKTDVDALAQLLPKMAPQLELSRALIRGRYMAAVARMEWCGTPIDVPTLELMRSEWSNIQADLIAQVDSQYGVYDSRTFKLDRFATYLSRHDIPWPTLESGQLALDDNTFRQMARLHPIVAPLRELRYSLGQLKLESLAVGSDGRNRCLLSPFQSKTGRNQPSNSKFIYGPSCWLRGLIKPSLGQSIAYVDWGQQEFGIAASLSGDIAMCEAYESGDPYLAFAKQAGAVPDHATKQSHPGEREQFKFCALGVQYGMGPHSLAQSLGQTEAHARQLLQLHHQTYPTFWRWSQSVVDHAMLYGWLQTVFGWPVHVGPHPNPRSLANFPMQANGAEMLRLGCCLATEWGIQVCAPVHDAILVEGPSDEIDDVIRRTQEAMAEASKIVLDGFELRTDCEVVSYPDRYMDKRGQNMWDTVTDLLAKRTQANVLHSTAPTCNSLIQVPVTP